MKSLALGTDISDSSITSVTSQGFWVLVWGKEYFVPFADYPVFATAMVSDLFTIETVGKTGLYWPALDADIELEALENPAKFPLLFH
ncbi:MAG: DUF2442 domain-containing protein [Chloroflexi bacterium]|nr:DUF2442 domain-containing protein [Chloroflexota bacterium]